MTTALPVPSKTSISKRPLNEFLFKIVNSFSLDEFKKYTNFPELMQEVVEKTVVSDPVSLNDRIRHNFKRNVPDEDKWRRGGFRALKLKADFYGSNVATRIFKNIYGLKECAVCLGLPKKLIHAANREERLKVSTDKSDTANIAEVNLTKSDESSIANSNTPKHVLKYPRKTKTEKSMAISGIQTYMSTSEFVKKISQTPEGFEDKIKVSSIEPAKPSSKRIEIISNVVLVPPTPFRDEIIQRQPNPNSDSLRRASKHKIRTESKVQRRKVVYIDEDTDELPVTNARNKTSPNLSKPKVGPKSIMSQSNNMPAVSNVKTTEDLLEDLMDTIMDPSEVITFDDPKTQSLAIPARRQEHSPITTRIGPAVVSNQRNSQFPSEKLSMKAMHTGLSVEQKSPVGESPKIIFAEPKPKIGPKSRISQPNKSNDKATQDLLHDLMHTNPPSIVEITEPPTEPLQTTAINQLEVSQTPSPTTKPRCGPKSAMLSRQQFSRENLSENKSMHHAGPSIVSLLSTKPKPKSPIPPQLIPLPMLDDVNVAVPEGLQGVFGPISPANSSPQSDRTSKNQPVEPHSNNKPQKTSPSRSSQFNAKSTENVDTEIPRQSHPSNQLHIGSQGEVFKTHQTLRDTPVECICAAGSDALTQCNDSSEFRNIVKRSVGRAIQHLSKYLAEVDPNVHSLNHFWSDFHRFEAEEDNSAAETQLSNSIEHPSGMELEMQSQAILHSDQLDTENSDKKQMEPQSFEVDHLEVEIVHRVEPHEIQMEQQSSMADPHSGQFVEYSEGQIKTNIKVEVFDHDHNETYSSDVQIIELPPDEPIEILLDDTQQLYENLQVDGTDSEEQLHMPIVISQQTSKKVSPSASSSKGFLTSLPVISNKKRNYQPLDIVVEAVQNAPYLELHAFSQQHLTPPSNENYQIEECTMTESMHQRYALLNDENSIFMSSQLEHYAFDTGKTIDPKSTIMHTDRTSQLLSLKRLSQDVLNVEPAKRRRCHETIKRELHWKIMDIRSITFKPLSNLSFHLELQLRNNYDTFHIQDQSSIKRILHLSNNECKHIAKIVTALNGHRYDSAAAAIAARTLDLPSRLMDCFVQSVPIFVRSNIQFKDFMGHCLEVSEQQPLRNECVDGAFDPNILRKMEELKKLLDTS